MSAQGTTYAEFIRHHEEVERARRASLDARGVGIVTTNGAFATLVTGGLVAIQGTKDLRLAVPATVALIVALLLLVGSGFVGLHATRLKWYTVTSPDTMHAMLTSPRWTDDEVDARNACALSTLRTVESLRHGNKHKADSLAVAVYLQMFAVVALAATAAIQVIAGR